LKKLGEGLVDVVAVVDDPHVSPRNSNVRTAARELLPARAGPAVQVVSSISTSNVLAIGAVDGLQRTWNKFPGTFARQHAVNLLVRVDDPLLAVGANGNMGTSARKSIPFTILVLVQLLGCVNADGTIMSPGVDLNAGTRHLVPSLGGCIPSVNILGGVAAPDGIIDAGSSPDSGTRELRPAVVVIVPLVDRLA